jgi:hypothetical protein
MAMNGRQHQLEHRDAGGGERHTNRNRRKNITGMFKQKQGCPTGKVKPR